MNYITACPACATQFLITKEHLKAYRGKVQCGNCNHIFNAKNRLTEISEDIQENEQYSPAESEAEAVEHSKTAYAGGEIYTNPEVELDELITDASDFESTTDKTIATESTDSADENAINDKLNIVLQAVPDLSNLTSVGLVENLDSSESTDKSHFSNHIAKSASEDDRKLDRAPILIEDLSTDPKFQLMKPKRNFWLLCAIFLLLIIALLQSIYFLRTKIAAHYPQFKPYLMQICAPLHCKINLPQKLDLLTIDDSDMKESEIYQDVIDFSSLIINNASYVQAYPNIELTLTDAQDKPVLRRLVKPQEYLQHTSNPDTGIAAREEERIKLTINVHNLSVAGYRVLLTY